MSRAKELLSNIEGVQNGDGLLLSNLLRIYQGEKPVAHDHDSASHMHLMAMHHGFRHETNEMHSCFTHALETSRGNKELTASIASDAMHLSMLTGDLLLAPMYTSLLNRKVRKHYSTFIEQKSIDINSLEVSARSGAEARVLLWHAEKTVAHEPVFAQKVINSLSTYSWLESDIILATRAHILETQLHKAWERQERKLPKGIKQLFSVDFEMIGVIRDIHSSATDSVLSRIRAIVQCLARRHPGSLQPYLSRIPVLAESFCSEALEFCIRNDATKLAFDLIQITTGPSYDLGDTSGPASALRKRAKDNPGNQLPLAVMLSEMRSKEMAVKPLFASNVQNALRKLMQ